MLLKKTNKTKIYLFQNNTFKETQIFFIHTISYYNDSKTSCYECTHNNLTLYLVSKNFNLNSPNVSNLILWLNKILWIHCKPNLTFLSLNFTRTNLIQRFKTNYCRDSETNLPEESETVRRHFSFSFRFSQPQVDPSTIHGIQRHSRRSVEWARSRLTERIKSTLKCLLPILAGPRFEIQRL